MAVHHHPIACAYCGTVFTPTRSDTRFCHVNCRVSSHRKHKRQQEIEARNGDDHIRARWIESLRTSHADEVASLDKYHAEVIEQARWDPITAVIRRHYAIPA